MPRSWNLIEKSKGTNDTFVSSFSRPQDNGFDPGDRLSQWRGYSHGSQGFSLGFDPDSVPVPLDWSRKVRAYVETLKADPNRPLGDEPFEHFVLKERANTWNTFLNWSNDLAGSWCFRGQHQATWLLHPSQDRATLVQYKSKYSSGYCHFDRRSTERALLFQFKQRAHHYLKHLPADEDLASWLGLMQHHGIPTRFLDWTHSAFVALYFALEEAAQ